MHWLARWRNGKAMGRNISNNNKSQSIFNARPDHMNAYTAIENGIKWNWENRILGIDTKTGTQNACGDSFGIAIDGSLFAFLTMIVFQPIIARMKSTHFLKNQIDSENWQKNLA